MQSEGRGCGVAVDAPSVVPALVEVSPVGPVGAAVVDVVLDVEHWSSW